MIWHFVGLLLSLILPDVLINAHSWIEEAAIVDANGRQIGPRGYARNNVFRVPGVDVDEAMTYKLPQAPYSRVNDTDNLCSNRQAYPDTSLALHAAPGDTVSLRYQENGHITLPEASPGKPSSGTVYVYGTWQPAPVAKFRDVHHIWGFTGYGQNEDGFLLAQSPFDDGQCYQVNNGNISRIRQAAFPHEVALPEGENKWCATTFDIPRGPVCAVASGAQFHTLTIYWIWDWPGTPGNSSAEQYYTTCLDIVVSL